jgi:short-subunit dehydrogenase
VTADRGSAAARVVIVTGATSGIGLCTALAFAARGDHLVLTARSQERLDATAAECRQAGAASAETISADVLKRADVDRVVEAAMAAHGWVDIVVHSATVMAYGTIENVPDEVFTRVVDTAIHGTAHLARAVIPLFRKQKLGTFIIVNSLLGAIAVPQMGAYVTAKWGQLGLARVLQLETRNAPGVRVCYVQPGGVNTPIYLQAANYAGRQGRPPIPVDPPEKVAVKIVRCADRPRNRISVGIANPVIVAGFRLLPRVYDVLVGPLVNLGALSRTAVAPTAGNVAAPRPSVERAHGHWPEPADGGSRNSE